MEEGEERASTVVIACGKSSKVLELVETVFDAVALAIERRVMRDFHLS